MQFEEFDDKIREAAEHHHPVYQEDAWGKMEKLLDKHMPVEKDRKRRVIFFLLFALLLGAAAWYLTGKTGSGKSGIAANSSNTAASKPVDAPVQSGNNELTEPINNKTITGTADNDQPIVNPADNTGTSNNTTTVKTNDQSITGKAGVVPVQMQPVQSTDTKVTKNKFSPRQNAVVASSGNRNSFNPPSVKTTMGKSRTASKPDHLLTATVDQPASQNKVTHPSDNPAAFTTVQDQQQITTDTRSLNHNQPVTSSVIADPVVAAKQDETKPATAVEKAAEPDKTASNKTAKVKSKKKSQFFLFASVAPDVSYTSNAGKAGALKPAVGAGIGYTYKGKLSIRAGFFTARKEYTAPPAAYHGSASFYSYYPNLESIDGNCKVYEIPVLLSYNFGAAKKHSWFAGAGLSSYLMKKETYTYFYKPIAGGALMNHSYSVTNKNKHYFSVLDVSAGYTRKLGKSFSISAEPYVKLPFSGVGLGKVKLNSAGVMFSVGFTPFGTKK